MRIEYSKTAFKQLKKLPKNEQIKVLKKIEVLKAEPLRGKKLKGQLAKFYSFKAWPYRLIYSFYSKEQLLFIHVVEHRQGAYS